jgi:hypothetical protein
MKTPFSFTIPHSEALILFDLLKRWDGKGSALALQDDSERRVLLDLFSKLEESLVEPFLKDYDEIVERARKDMES